MLRLAAPFVGFAVSLASPSHAQSAPPSQPPAPSSGLREGMPAVESGATWMGWANWNVSANTDCAQVVMQAKGLDAEAAALERLSKGFGKIGDGLTLITAGSQAAQGRYTDMTQTMAEAAFDKTVCAIWPGPVCAGWSAGKLVGTTIKMMPLPYDSKHRTIEEAVLDGEVRLAQWLMPSLNQPMNIENMRRAFEEFQRQRTALLNARERAQSAANQCKMNDERRGADEEAGAARLGTSADRATARLNDLAPPYTPAAGGWDGQYQVQAPSTYSAPPAQQSQGSSGSDWTNAIGAALQGYALGKSLSGGGQGSSSSQPSSAPAPSGSAPTMART